MSLAHALEALKIGADRVIETSCATVILKGPRAYKLKKCVDFGFLDFTSPQKRSAALHRELQYNQRLAAHIYLGVEEVAGETVLVMQRFDTDSVMAELAGGGWTPPEDLLRDLGQAIARFHAGSEVSRDDFHTGNIGYVLDTSRDNFNLFREALGAEAVKAYDAAITAAHARLHDDILRRFDRGHIRHCHGDLHLGNILIENGRPVLFDCIEFNERLSQIDVLYDMAFLLMDLWVRGLYAAANRVMNAWLEQATRLENDPVDVMAGLNLLPFYMSVRAGVRCHVSAHQGDIEAARRYMQAALAFLQPAPATLQAIGGLSGSGKSTRARQLAPGQGRAPGAVILRSDEVRKRLWAWPEFEVLPPEAYAAEETARTHADMFALARGTLHTGQSVILDATFRDNDLRLAAEDVATSVGLGFEGLWLDVPAGIRGSRVAARRGDASDATRAIAETQADVDPASVGWRIEHFAVP